jgi:pentatricopeptide repeat protein
LVCFASTTILSDIAGIAMGYANQVLIFMEVLLVVCFRANDVSFALRSPARTDGAISLPTINAARKITNEVMLGINQQQESKYIQHGPVRMEYDCELSAANIAHSEAPNKLIRTIQFATQLEKIVRQSKHPTNEQFESLVDAWIRVGQPDKAENLFRHLIDSNKLRLSRTTYRVLISAYVQAENFSRALDILDAMESSSLTFLHPKTMDYNLVLAGYASNGSTYIQDAEQLFERMKQRNNPICSPDVYSYSHIFDMLLLSGYQDIGDRIDDVLNLLDPLPLAGSYNLSRKRLEYQSIFRKALKFWKQSRVPDAARYAEATLRRMEELGLADSISYTMYMTTLVQNRCEVESALAVSTICENMLNSHLAGNVNVKPTCQAWNTVLSAWVRCGQPDRAEQLLYRMQRDFCDDREMAPTVVSYSTVMDGWAKSNHKDAVENMENLFESMQRLSLSSGVENSISVQPNQWTFTSLIHAYAKQNDMISTQKAENLIHDMYDQYLGGNTELKPNTILVTAVLQAWGKTGTMKGAEKSEALLDWMIAVDQTDESGDLAPNEFSFSSKCFLLGLIYFRFVLTSCFYSCHFRLG